MAFLPLYFLFITLLFAFIYFYRKRKSRVFSFLTLVYCVSAFFSILYVYTDFFIMARKQEYELTFLPFFYWLLCYFVLSIPIIKFDRLSISKFQYSPKLVRTICYVSLLVSIVPLVELLPHLRDIFGVGEIASTFSDIHDDNEKELPLSFVGRQCYRFIRYMYLPILLCLIPVVTQAKRKLVPIIGIVFAVCVVIIAALILSTRGIILSTMIYFVLLALLFYPILKRSSFKKIIYTMSIIVSVVVIAFVIITISRNIIHQESSNNYTMYAFLTRYAGEGFINFNQYIEHIAENTNGDYCFYVIKKIAGIDMPQIDRDYISTVVQRKVGIPMMVFYTFIGFFVIDIGSACTLLFFVFVSLLVYKEIKTFKGVLYFHQLFLMFMYSSIIASGTCLYQYSWNSSAQLLFMILFYFLLKIVERAKK